jgi:hypothetical protein
MQHPGKFRMHWLGPYVIQQVTETGVVWLETLNGEVFEGMVNGSWLKLYRDGPTVCAVIWVCQNTCIIVVVP